VVKQEDKIKDENLADKKTMIGGYWKNLR